MKSNKFLKAIKRVKDDKKYQRCIDIDDLNTVEMGIKALELLLNKLKPSLRCSYEYFAGCVLGSWSNVFCLTEDEYHLLEEVIDND